MCNISLYPNTNINCFICIFFFPDDQLGYFSASNVDKKVVKEFMQEVGKHPDLDEHTIAKLITYECQQHEKHDRGWYRVNASRQMFGRKKVEATVEPHILDVRKMWYITDFLFLHLSFFFLFAIFFSSVSRSPLHYDSPKLCKTGVKRNIFQRGQSQFSQFFPGMKYVFPSNIVHFDRPQTNFSCSKSQKSKKKKKKKKKKIKSPLLIFLPFPLPFTIFPPLPFQIFLILSIFPFFPFLPWPIFPGRSAKIPRWKMSGGHSALPRLLHHCCTISPKIWCILGQFQSLSPPPNTLNLLQIIIVGTLVVFFFVAFFLSFYFFISHLSLSLWPYCHSFHPLFPLHLFVCSFIHSFIHSFILYSI